MVRDNELLSLGIELARLICERKILENKLIGISADIGDFGYNLFKICISEYSEEIEWLKDKDKLTSMISDDSYCDNIYPVLSNNSITFCDYNGEPLIRMIISPQYETESREF